MRIIICALVSILFSFGLRADIITLQDGREIRGTVVESDDDGIYVDTGISTVFFSHGRVKNIEEEAPEIRLLNRAQSAYQSRNYTRAYEFISEALEKAPENEEIQAKYEIYEEAYLADSIEQAQFELRMIDRFIQSDELIRANKALEELEVRFKNIEEVQQTIREKRVAIYLEWGEQAKQRYNFTAALNHIQRAKELVPESEDIYVLELDLLRRTSQPPNVIEQHLKEMVELFPRRYEYVHALARHYYDREEYSRTISTFDEYFQNFDDMDQYKEAKDMYAFSHFSVGNRIRVHDSEKALEHYKKSLEYNPMLNENYLRIGEILHQKGQNEEALEYLETAQERLSSNPRVFFISGEIQAYFRRYNEAERYYQRGLSLSERQRNTSMQYGSLVSLAELNYNHNNMENAIENARAAIEVDEDRLRGHYWLGVALSAEERLEEGNESLYRALSRNPNHEPTLLALAKNKMQSREYDEARRMLLDLLNQNPDNANYYFKLGEVYFLQSQYIAAEIQYQRALERNENLIDAYLRLSDIYRVREEPEKALEQTFLAGEIAPNDSRVYLKKGIIYQTTLEQYENALENYIKYYELGGTDPQVRSWIREVRAKLRQQER